MTESICLPTPGIRHPIFDRERDVQTVMRCGDLRLRLSLLDPENSDRRAEELPSSVVRPLSSGFQKGGDPAAGSPTATLLRLHPSR